MLSLQVLSVNLYRPNRNNKGASVDCREAFAQTNNGACTPLELKPYRA